MMIAENSLQHIIESQKDKIQTPYYFIDEARLLANLKKIQMVREKSGAKSVLALKCFSTWAVFDLISQYLDGTTSSSLFEAKLGHEKFGKEVHAYSVAFSDNDIDALKNFSTKIIFNSVSQLRRHYPKVKHLPIGLRVNPGISYSHFDLADPARRYSRLGVSDRKAVMDAAPLINGVMFHFNCENDDFGQFKTMMEKIGHEYEPLLKKLAWVSLGGGLYFTKEGYPLDEFCQFLSDWAQRYKVQIYLEPGEATITQSGFLVTSVLDIIHNEIDVAIVDSAVECHMLDLLIYRQDAKIEPPSNGSFTYMIAGKTCLAGDIFGTYQFPKPLSVGDVISLADAAGYTMVKKNWFNGVAMPSIVIKRLSGQIELVKKFGYEEYLASLS